ncbi:MAG: NfeD family protein [Gammaproteobacteria bacterium]|nr:NfeD family protein [Gammaproteobacteria bacterium]
MTPALFYLLLALALIGMELLIMQLSVFWFLFIGLGALVAALAGWVMPELSWTAVTALFLVSSIVISVALYRPLMRWQNKPAPIAGNDAIGQTVKVVQAISADSEGKVQWSGTDWPARLAAGEEPLAEGQSAVIRKLEGIRLIVGH